MHLLKVEYNYQNALLSLFRLFVFDKQPIKKKFLIKELLQ